MIKFDFDKKYGKYTVIDKDLHKVNGKLCVKCQCDCGKINFIYYCDLNRGQSQSCRACVRRTHGKTKHKLFGVWQKIRDRCYNENYKEYHLYGGKGIKLCDEWYKDFQVFYDWSIQNGYIDHLYIDRKDGDVGYEPNNCRWITPRQSSYNTSKTRFNRTSQYKGVHKSGSKWRASIRFNYKLIHLGYFIEEVDAAKAYNNKAKELFGEFAYLNNIGD